MSDQKWGQIVARAWNDSAFKKRLLAEPAAVLKEHGITVPPSVQVKVMEDTEKVCYLTLPVRRSEAELAENELARAVAGVLMTPFLNSGYVRNDESPDVRVAGGYTTSDGDLDQLA